VAAISQVRKIDSIEELDAMQCEADSILRETLNCYDNGAIEEADLAAYSLVLGQFHHGPTRCARRRAGDFISRMALTNRKRSSAALLIGA
jgi:hypothetical protein